MFVTPSFPAQTVAEFIAYAKANPGKVNFASAGAGNSNHISAEMFKMMTGVDMVHVPFNGGAPALLALASGHVQMMFADTLTAGEQAKAGTIRAIGVATSQRSPLMPDVPPIADTVPGFRASSRGASARHTALKATSSKRSIPKSMPPLPTPRSRNDSPRWAR